MEFQEFENENGGTVLAHVVTEETAGTVHESVSNRTVDVTPGDVLIKTARDGEYELPDRDWFNSTYNVRVKTAQNDESVKPSGESSDGEPFDPSAHSAADVKRYLDSIRYEDPDEYDRVRAAEADGKGRASALA